MNTADYFIQEMLKPETALIRHPVQPRVLLVDDDKDFTLMLSDKLKGAGCSVAVAHDSTQAIQKVLDAVKFRHVLVDLHFPAGAHGIQILKSIKAIDESLPVTIMSGFMTPEMMEVAKEKGYNVIDKDADISTLRKLIIGAENENNSATQNPKSDIQ